MIHLDDYDRVVAVKWKSCGQPRPYADSIYDAELLFTGKNISTKPETTVVVQGAHPGEALVKSIAKVLVHWFQEDNKHCMESWLEICECIEKVPGLSRWHIRIVSPYCD